MSAASAEGVPLTHLDLGGGLGMEFGREGDLEEHVLHHIATQRARQRQVPFVFRLEGEIAVAVTEGNIIEAPLRRTESAGDAHLATQGDIRQPHAA